MERSTLSPTAVKVLLALLLVREREAAANSTEFATVAGLPEQLIRMGLHEIEQAQLIAIIARERADVYKQPTSIVIESAKIHSSVVVGAEVQAATAEVVPSVSFVAALQSLWDEVFPESEYPFQRLTDATAKMWIRRYGDDFVREVLIDVRHTTSKKIESPRAYVEKVLKEEWKERAATINDSGSEITDELMELLRVGGRKRREQANKNLG